MPTVDYLPGDPINFQLLSKTTTAELKAHLDQVHVSYNLVSSYLDLLNKVPLAKDATDPDFINNLTLDLEKMKQASMAIHNELAKRSEIFFKKMHYLDLDTEEME